HCARTLCDIFSFSLYRALPSPDLHSFPTRRSSDLVRQAAGHGRLAACAPRRLRFGPRKQWQRRVVFLSCAGAERDANPERIKPADRKSTRLNSSHVSISYAVFCLKKKKIQNNITHA